MSEHTVTTDSGTTVNRTLATMRATIAERTAQRNAANATNTRLFAERAELVAALEQITRTPALSNGALLMQDIARAAIARAKGL